MMEAKTAERKPGTELEQMPEAPPAPAMPMPVMGQAELERSWKIAAALAKSGLFKDAQQPGQAFAKMLAGRDLGLSPTEAMTALHVIEGKIESSAHLHAMRVKESEKYDYKVRELSNEKAVIEFFEHTADGRESIGTSEFSVDDADRASLRAEKETRGGRKMESLHVKYPRNMLWSRAMTNGVEWFCPDVMGGLRVYGTGEIEVGMAATDGEPGGTIDTQAASMDDVPWPKDEALRTRLQRAVDAVNHEEPNRYTPAMLQMQLGGQPTEKLVEIADRMEEEAARFRATRDSEEEKIEDAEVVEGDEGEKGAEERQEGPGEASEPEGDPEAERAAREHIEALRARRRDLEDRVQDAPEGSREREEAGAELDSVMEELRNVAPDDSQGSLGVE